MSNLTLNNITTYLDNLTNLSKTISQLKIILRALAVCSQTAKKFILKINKQVFTIPKTMLLKWYFKIILRLNNMFILN